MKKLIIDVCGADAGPLPVIEGAATALLESAELYADLAGSEPQIRAVMRERGVPEDRYGVLHTDEYVTNHDDPMCVMSDKDNSSLVLALKALRDDPLAVGMVSAGNTGAVMIGTILYLGLLPGLRQPTLATVLPTEGDRYICIADCGANVDCKAADMIGFALMGDEYMKCMCGVPSPRVGLLSVGREDGKGSQRAREAYEEIKKLPLDFIGNVEGSDVLSDICDVVVCDGFSGNVILKNAEAVGKYAGRLAEATLRRYAESMGETADEGAVDALRRSFFRQFDFNSQGGAFFFGTVKPVVKMHGAANSSTTVSCVAQALALDASGFTDRLRTVLKDKLPPRRLITRK